MTCPHCGQPHAGTRFCTSCGASLAEESHGEIHMERTASESTSAALKKPVRGFFRPHSLLYAIVAVLVTAATTYFLW